MGTDTFSSPTMRARAALVRGLQLTDEVERAWARRDWSAVAKLADAIRDQLVVLSDAAEVMAPTPERPGAGPDEVPGSCEHSAPYGMTAQEWHAQATTLGHNPPHPLAELAEAPTSAMSETELRSAYGDR